MYTQSHAHTPQTCVRTLTAEHIINTCAGASYGIAPGELGVAAGVGASAAHIHGVVLLQLVEEEASELKMA